MSVPSAASPPAHHSRDPIPPDRGRIALPPPPATPFVGREAEIAAGQDLLFHGPRRLITLTGPGGVGKSRLALHLAALGAEHQFTRIDFVPLAPVSDALLVPRAIGTALGLPAEEEIPWLPRIVAALRGQRSLLVLDNLEHLLPVGPRIADLLAACPDLRILATSRTRLRISDEQEIPVPPLPVGRESRVPSHESRDHPTHVSQLTTHHSSLITHDWDAVTLFIERVRAIRPAYDPGEREIGTIAAICHRLDGLPLAIELAAARMSHLTADALLRALGQLLPLLTTGQRDAQPRHRTMRDAIAWSVDLLPGPTREWFIRLGAFPASFPLDAAVRVGDPGGSRPPELAEVEALDAIAELIDANLLTVADSHEPDEPRWQMYDTVREYARERLQASGLIAETNDRLSAWLVEADAAGQHPRDPDQPLRPARPDTPQPAPHPTLLPLTAPAHERGRADALSDREIDVLTLVARGHSDREIGDLLSISPRTVSNHVRGILAKLKVSTRTAAAATAIRDGLVPT